MAPTSSVECIESMLKLTGNFHIDKKEFSSNMHPNYILKKKQNRRNSDTEKSTMLCLIEASSLCLLNTPDNFYLPFILNQN